ncbi:MAG: DUF5665 domain-containing protein [Patescibacteria group bacterium]
MEEKNKKTPVIKNPKEVAKALEVLFASDYIDVKRLHWENFVRGMFFGAGGVIGATVFIAIIIWFLSIFDSVPVIGPIFEDAKTTIETKQ